MGSARPPKQAPAVLCPLPANRTLDGREYSDGRVFTRPSVGRPRADRTSVGCGAAARRPAVAEGLSQVAEWDANPALGLSSGRGDRQDPEVSATVLRHQRRAAVETPCRGRHLAGGPNATVRLNNGSISDQAGRHRARLPACPVQRPFTALRAPSQSRVKQPSGPSSDRQDPIPHLPG